MAGLKDIAHRRWHILRDLWVDFLPQIDLSAEFPEPTLWHLPNLAETLGNPGAGAELPYVEGIRESVFREAILLTRKFTYCRMVSLQAATTGFPTWAIVAGYDACFFGAKAFCYLLGIVSLSRHSKMYLDLFVPRNYKVGKMRKEAYDILVVHRLEKNLTHEILWSLTSRLSRTLHLPDAAEALERELRLADFEQVPNLRNNLIYDGGFWFGSDNFEGCDLVRRLSNVSLYRAIRIPSDKYDVAERYFRIADKLGGALAYFLSDIAALAPAITPEVTALTNWHAYGLLPNELAG